MTSFWEMLTYQQKQIKMKPTRNTPSNRIWAIAHKINIFLMISMAWLGLGWAWAGPELGLGWAWAGPGLGLGLGWLGWA